MKYYIISILFQLKLFIGLMELLTSKNSIIAFHSLLV